MKAYSKVLIPLTFLLLGACGGSSDDGVSPSNEAEAEITSCDMPNEQVGVALDIGVEGVVINWVWPDETSADFVSVSRRPAEESSTSDVVELFRSTDRATTRYADVYAKPGRHYYSVAFSDLGDCIVAVGDGVIAMPTRVLSIEPPIYVTTEPYSPAVVDYNGDGFIEVFGAINLDDGQIVPIDAASLGVSELFAPGRVSRDNRLADLDADGDWDVISNGYSSIADNDTVALLHWNQGQGIFYSDVEFSGKAIKGYGETIVTFDYDNDTHLDIFLPYYSHNSPEEHSYLLENDGNGHFVDIADSAGVALRNIPSDFRVEGAQAADLNDDGHIDLFVASHLFINRGDGTFYDAASEAGLPQRFDEGLKILDWNADGALDLLFLHPNQGPVIYEQRSVAETPDGTPAVPIFERRDVFPESIVYDANCGVNSADLNNDGLPDVIIASGTALRSIALINHRESFQLVEDTALTLPGAYIDLIGFGDFNDDGRQDIVRKSGGILLQFNVTPSFGHIFQVLVLGEGGLFNQQGRVVRLTPATNPDFVMTQVVDGGSGYMAQGQYELQFASPFPGTHTVEIVYADKRVSFTVVPGDRAAVRSDGNVRMY